MIDFLRELLFESLPMLLVAELIAIGLAVAVHRRRLTRGSRRGIWIMLAVCAFLAILQRVVVTDQEAIELMVRAMAKTVKEGDATTFGTHVDEGFRAGTADKQSLMAVFNQRLTEWRIDAARVTILSVEVQGDSAVVRFRVFCDLRSERQSEDNVMTYWKIRCVRDAGEWKMQGVESAEFGPGILTRQGGLDLMQYLGFRG
jgi:hypothetical protein